MVLGGGALQVWVLHHPGQQSGVYRALRGQPPAVVKAGFSLCQPRGKRVHDHIARAGVKGKYVIQGTAFGKYGDIADAADILQPHGALRVPIKQVFRVGDQWSPKPAGSHVPNAEIADDRTAQPFRNNGRLAGLKRAPHRAAKVFPCVRRVEYGLAVAAPQS